MIMIPLTAIAFVISFGYASGRGEGEIANRLGRVDHAAFTRWRVLVVMAVWCVAAAVLYHWTAFTLLPAMWAGNTIASRLGFNLGRERKDGRHYPLAHVTPLKAYEAAWIMALTGVDRRAAEISHKCSYLDEKADSYWTMDMHFVGRFLYVIESVVLLITASVTLYGVHQHFIP